MSDRKHLFDQLSTMQGLRAAGDPVGFGLPEGTPVKGKCQLCGCQLKDHAQSMRWSKGSPYCMFCNQHCCCGDCGALHALGVTCECP